MTDKPHQLSIELVPASAYGRNVREILTKTQWSIISKQVRSAAYDTCEICHSQDGQLDCHEIWFYNDNILTQKLIGLIALCKKCHGVKHFGLSELQGKRKETLLHFMKINNLSQIDAEKAIHKSFEIWEKRSQFQWKLDISKLKDYGIDIAKIQCKVK